ncbi:hypothetical protein Efla_001831 [Eimeria flavescens]
MSAAPMVCLRPLKHAIWAIALATIALRFPTGAIGASEAPVSDVHLAASDIEASAISINDPEGRLPSVTVGGRPPTDPASPADAAGSEGKPGGGGGEADVDASPNAKTVKGNIDAIIEGMEAFRPGQRQLKRGSTFDEHEPLRTNLAVENLQNLEATLATQWLSNAVKEGGEQRCKEAKALHEQCPGAEDALSPLQCSMEEIPQAKEVAVAVESATSASDPAAQQACARILTKLLHYIDLMVFYTPFASYQEGVSPQEALEKAFSHWELSREGGSGGQAQGSDAGDAARDAAPSIVELRQVFSYISKRITSSHRGPELQAVKEEVLKEPVHAKELLFKGLTTAVLQKNPKAMLFLSAAYNPALKAGLMLLLLAHLRFEELFRGTRHSPRSRMFPNLITFLSSPTASQRQQTDTLCQVKLQKIRELPKVPSGYRFIPRIFLIRKSLSVGIMRLACDQLDGAVTDISENYQRGLNHFNEIMSHLPPEERRQAVTLQKNTAPAVNLRRLCFGLATQPGADLIEKPQPCSLNELRLPQKENGSSPSFLEAGENAIAKPEASDQTALSLDGDKTDFYLDLIITIGNGCSLHAGEEICCLSTMSAGNDFPLSRDPRTFEEIVAATNKNTAACDKVRSDGFNREIAKRGLKSAMEFAQKCTDTKSLEMWKEWKCEKYFINLHCSYLHSAWLTISNRIDISKILGWLARQESCIGHHCQDWQKLHPYKVLASRSAAYELLGFYSAWVRAVIVFHDWFGLYSFDKKNMLTADAIHQLNGFQATYMVEGKYERRGFLRKLLGARKKKQKLTTSHVRFLMSQLSGEAMFALQSAFRPVVHPDTFHVLNQYQTFMSEASGEQSEPGGIAQRLEMINRTWTYAGMPQNVQEKVRQGLSPKMEDYKGLDLTKAPPETNDMSQSLKKELLTVMATLSRDPAMQEEFWLSCRGPSWSSSSLQLFRDSHHLLTQAGDELLLVGIVINPNQTSAGLHKNLLDRLFKAVRGAVNKFLRYPVYVLQHATYVAVVPDYARVALVVKELSQIYIRNSEVFSDANVFRSAVNAMLEIQQSAFFSPAGLPAAVPVTALLRNVDPYYNMMDAKQRAAEFRRSVMATFYAHIWKLVMNLSFETMVSPKATQKREKQYSDPAWQRALMDPLQMNSFRMVLCGGDLGYTMFDKTFSREQKRMLRSVKFGSGLMFSHNMLMAGKVYTELGYVSYGNFITAQAPFLGKVITDWMEKRQRDRVREIFGWIGLALFFVGTVVQLRTVDGTCDSLRSIANALNDVASSDIGRSLVPDAVGNQSGLTGAGACGPLGICLDGVDKVAGGVDNPADVPPVPDMSASPVLTAIFIVARTVLMATLSSLLGPAVSIYLIVSSHWKFLERLETAVENLFKWIVYKIRHSKFGRWFVKLRESRKSKQEAKRLAELAGKQAEASGSEEGSVGDLESDTYPVDTIEWDGMFDTGNEETPPKKPPKGNKFKKLLFKKKSSKKKK